MVEPRDGQDERQLQLLALKRKRAASFRSEVWPYFRYVAQSGFGLLVAAFFFTAIFGYSDLLRDVPPDFPADFIGAAALACAAIWTPLRTYLRQADTVFLLPMETQVQRFYIRPALKMTAARSVVRVLIVYAVYLPLYLAAPVTSNAAASRPIWLAGLLLMLLAVWNVCGSWQERRLAGVARRLLFRVARIAITLLAAWALLNSSFWPAAGMVAGLLLLLGIGWLNARNAGFPWEQLIKEEARTVRRWQRFLGWFVDMPTADAKAARRRWAAWIGERLPWTKERAWHYWQTKAFVRGETFGAWMRWHLAIAFILLVADHQAADGIAYVIGFFVGGIQLTELVGHRLDPSVQTLPLSREGRFTAAAAVARRAGMAGAVLLWLLAAFPHGLDVALSWTSLALLAAGLIWSGWRIPRRLKHFRSEDED